MAKLKITEAQVEMLKEFEDEQLVQETAISRKPANLLKKALKKGVHDMTDKIKIENYDKLLGHPVAGSGGDEYKPQSEKENEKTFKSFNESIMNENKSLPDFARKVIDSLKILMIKPEGDITGILKELGMSKDKYIAMLEDLGVILFSDNQIKVLKSNLVKGISKLFKMTSPEPALETETMDSDDIKKSFSKQLGTQTKTGKSPEELKTAIAAKRKKELERRKTETTTAGASSGAFVTKLEIQEDVKKITMFSDEAGIEAKTMESIMSMGDDIEIAEECGCSLGEEDVVEGNEMEETTVAGASVDGGSSGPYVTPKIWAKSDKDHVPAKRTQYPGGKIVDPITKKETKRKGSVVSEAHNYKLYKRVTINEDNQTDTSYPDGEFVEFDDCVKLNNNGKALNGGCNAGGESGVVKKRKTKGSVVSGDALYYEVAKITGKSIDEVKRIIEKQ